MGNLKQELIKLVHEDYEVICEMQRGLDIDLFESEQDEIKARLDKIDKHLELFKKQLNKLSKKPKN